MFFSEHSVLFPDSAKWVSANPVSANREDTQSHFQYYKQKPTKSEKLVEKYVKSQISFVIIKSEFLKTHIYRKEVYNTVFFSHLMQSTHK